MKASTRIYVIAPRTSDETPVKRRLVRAATPAAALRHVASEFVVAVASQDDIVECVAAGVRVEDANAKEE